MPQVKVSLRLSFASGEESLHSFEAPATSSEGNSDETAPYRLNDTTAPEEPTLIASPNFVQVA